MTLADVLALRPAAGADTAILSASIADAEAKREALLASAKASDERRAAGLLQLDEKALIRLDQEAAQARLAADRIAALLPDLHADLAAARGQETLDKLRAEHAAAASLIEAVNAWHKRSWPTISALLLEGLRAEQAARTALVEFHASVKTAYRQTCVEDAGPLGVSPLKMPADIASAVLLRIPFGSTGL